MATTISTATGEISLTGTLQKTHETNTTVSAPFNISLPQTFENGTGAQNANMYFEKRSTLAGAGTVDIDLGAAVDAFGDTQVFTSIRGLVVYNLSTDLATTLAVGAAATNPVSSLFDSTTDEAIVRPGGMVMWLTGGSDDTDGYAVTENSADQLRITNKHASNTAAYRVVVLGTV